MLPSAMPIVEYDDSGTPTLATLTRFDSRRPMAAIRRNVRGLGRASKPSTASLSDGRFNDGSIVEKPATPPEPGPSRCTSGPIALCCGTPAVAAFQRKMLAVGADGSP